MQVKNFNIASTLTSGNGSAGNKSNNHFDAGGVESGFAALMRQQNLAASSPPMRAPAPAPAFAQFSASVAPPAPPTVPAPAPARLAAPAPPPAPAGPPTSMRASPSTPADKAPPTVPPGNESPPPASSPNARGPQIAKPARTADKSGPAKAGTVSSASADDLPVDKTTKAETTTVRDEAISPDLALSQQFVGLHLPTDPALAVPGGAHLHAAKSGSGDPAAADDAPDTSASHRGVDSTAAGNAAMKADAEVSGKAARGQVERPASQPVSDFAAAFAELRPAMSPAAQPGAAAAIDIAVAAAASGANFNPATGTTTELAPTQFVNLPTPVGAPDFAQTLGAQLSVLARDGVQQAELHLNPADMGPVSIQITMDGTQARIDFGADMAATRHAIEAGMPELASALADAGFTLAGGGVSQHPRGRGEGGRGESGSGQGARRVATASTDAAPASRMIRRAVSAGAVDIYA